MSYETILLSVDRPVAPITPVRSPGAGASIASSPVATGPSATPDGPRLRNSPTHAA